MSLPTRQQRALEDIERTLADDPGLGSMFAIFTRLAAHEAMPATEPVAGRPWRLRRPRWRRRKVMMQAAAAVVGGLAMVMAALFTPVLTPPGPPSCAGTARSIAGCGLHGH